MEANHSTSIFKWGLWSLLLLHSACLPRPLPQSWGEKAQGRFQATSSKSSALRGEPEAQEGTMLAQASSASPAGTSPATIFSIDKQSFKILLREEEVWDAALDVLLRNYNLNIINRNAGVVTTEWDSYYLDQGIYRNKISLRITRRSARSCELTIINNVETLRDGSSTGAGTIGPIWLPSEDPTGEVHRLVKNIAAVLGQPPPQLELPPPKIVKSTEKTYRFE